MNETELAQEEMHPQASDQELASFKLSAAALLRRRREAQMCYIFDLRDEEAFAEKCFPGSYNLPFAHLEANLHRLPFQGDLLFCDDRQRPGCAGGKDAA